MMYGVKCARKTAQTGNIDERLSVVRVTGSGPVSLDAVDRDGVHRSRRLVAAEHRRVAAAVLRSCRSRSSSGRCSRTVAFQRMTPVAVPSARRIAADPVPRLAGGGLRRHRQLVHQPGSSMILHIHHLNLYSTIQKQLSCEEGEQKSTRCYEERKGLVITANRRTNQDTLPRKTASKSDRCVTDNILIHNYEHCSHLGQRSTFNSIYHVLCNAFSHQGTSISDHKHAVLQQDSKTQPILETQSYP